jgi:PAS domain S-box-containing protein
MAISVIGKILVVDDEAELKNALVEALSAQSFEVRGFTSGAHALSALREEAFDVLISDLMMPEMDGITLIEKALEIDPHLVTIIMTGQGTIQTAVDAMKMGAFDYVLKPFRLQTLMPVLTRAINTRRLRLENLQLRETVAIYELCQTIAFTLDPQTILSKLADAALQQTQADEVSVLLPTDDGNELYVAAVRGENRQRLLGERVPLETSISGWVARAREPLILNGEINDERFMALWPHPEIRSAISVPMQIANKLVGVININAIQRPRSFTLGQTKAVAILASTAAAALESASLYEQVERQRKRLDNIVATVPGVVWEGWGRPEQASRRTNFVSDYVETMLGYSVDEWLSTPNFWLTIIHPNDREEAARSAAAAFAAGGKHTQQFRWVTKDGRTIWVEANLVVVTDSEGNPIGLRGVNTDITERKKAEEALRDSEERYRDLVENAHDIIYTHDLKGNYLSVNSAAEHITGYNREEAVKLNMSQTLAPECADKAREMIARKLAGENVTSYELDILAKDGRRIAIEVNSKLMYEDGVPVAVQGIARDVTERKQLEEQLRQSQKMEAIGQLAGGVAHDFNNLLTAINGYSSLALQRLDDDSPIRPYLEEVKKAGDRAANLTRQLLAFGRKQIMQPLALDLNSAVSDMNKMLRRLIGEDIVLTAKLPPDLSKIKADPGQVEQVLINLVVNARDAMPTGGNLTIETANVILDQEYAARHMGIEPGRYVMLAVSDTGSGMDEATRARIFEPFFTTKEKGKGTGLGLSTVYGIVQQSGGSIWVYSELNQGTTFKVYFPELRSQDAAQVLESTTEEIQAGSETILLVEDEEVVRGLTTNILEGAGYQVIAASGGAEAAKLYADRNEPIDLLLTDVVMPQTSGKVVAEQITKMQPGLRVLFMSGYTDEAIVHHGVLDANVEFIQKPFTPAALSRKVREVLDKKNGDLLRDTQ